MGTKWQKFELDLSDYDAFEREAIAVEVIDQIVKRTQNGKDKNGSAFAKYSKDYKNSLNFRNAGKSSSVDLTLSGDMLDSIAILSNRGGKVVIGFEKGSDENGKADGNIRGTFGQDRKVGPKRDFLGISEGELDKILKRYPLDDTKRASDRLEKRVTEVLTSKNAADRLSGAINVDDLED